jgi:hypothetical protein
VPVSWQNLIEKRISHHHMETTSYELGNKLLSEVTTASMHPPPAGEPASRIPRTARSTLPAWQDK